jgi:hypothetical protein
MRFALYLRRVVLLVVPRLSTVRAPGPVCAPWWDNLEP